MVYASLFIHSYMNYELLLLFLKKILFLLCRYVVLLHFPHWFPLNNTLCPDSLLKYCVVMPPCQWGATLYLNYLYNVTNKVHFLIILSVILQQKRIINIGFIFFKKQFQ